MSKITREYQELYGDIPEDKKERLYLLSKDLTDKQLETLKERMRSINAIREKEISFTIYMVPKGTPRPRQGRHNIFYVKDAKLNHRSFLKVLEEVKCKYKIDTATRLDIKCYFPIPDSMSKVDKVLAEMGYINNLSTPDWDNLGKTYPDMIQPELLLNDSLIYAGSVYKGYSSKPRVEVTIRFKDDYDSLYNKRKVTGWKQ